MPFYLYIHLLLLINYKNTSDLHGIENILLHSRNANG